MRNTDLVRLECDQCGQRFASDEDAKKHFHAVNKLSDSPLIYLLILPPGCNPGTMDAVAAFAKAAEELQAKHKDQSIKFQFIPLGYLHTNQSNQGYSMLESMLAVAM